MGPGERVIHRYPSGYVTRLEMDSTKQKKKKMGKQK